MKGSLIKSQIEHIDEAEKTRVQDVKGSLINLCNLFFLQGSRIRLVRGLVKFVPAH